MIAQLGISRGSIRSRDPGDLRWPSRRIVLGSGMYVAAAWAGAGLLVAFLL